eukprot:CAMPEP_0115871636 /NCGR_PEP_ID=MMETSP0287-20121206/22987_1 /TAXON_ID=412157 /ORGANISM="Chrysochromulina rotalis, Strain UIO044" /LENGTH=43 /DNA_ID= /DNA_START= /DNA_END= /DNA_ORIENTATION=
MQLGDEAGAHGHERHVEEQALPAAKGGAKIEEEVKRSREYHNE